MLEVVAGSAADKAGVLPGDTIVGVDDNQIGKKASASRRRLSCGIAHCENCHPHPYHSALCPPGRSSAALLATLACGVRLYSPKPRLSGRGQVGER